MSEHKGDDTNVDKHEDVENILKYGISSIYKDVMTWKYTKNVKSYDDDEDDNLEEDKNNESNEGDDITSMDKHEDKDKY